MGQGEIKIGYSTFSARCEDIDTKPAFREAFKRRRCLIPLDSFYERRKLGQKEEQPYAIALKDGGLMAMAGLWETWRSPSSETVRNATIITCPPNELVAELHNAMPVILAPAAWPAWLAETEVTRPYQLEALSGSPRSDVPAGPEIRERLEPGWCLASKADG